jgi:hypothetical protein
MALIIHKCHFFGAFGLMAPVMTKKESDYDGRDCSNR